MGGTERVRVSEIVGIFDLDGKLTAPDTADLLRAAEKAGKSRLAGDDLPKSFLLLRDGTVVFSVYAAAILKERMTP